MKNRCPEGWSRGLYLDVEYAREISLVCPVPISVDPNTAYIFKPFLQALHTCGEFIESFHHVDCKLVWDGYDLKFSNKLFACRVECLQTCVVLGFTSCLGRLLRNCDLVPSIVFTFVNCFCCVILCVITVYVVYPDVLQHAIWEILFIWMIKH